MVHGQFLRAADVKKVNGSIIPLYWLRKKRAGLTACFAWSEWLQSLVYTQLWVVCLYYIRVNIKLCHQQDMYQPGIEPGNLLIVKRTGYPTL